MTSHIMPDPAAGEVVVHRIAQNRPLTGGSSTPSAGPPRHRRKAPDRPDWLAHDPSIVSPSVLVTLLRPGGAAVSGERFIMLPGPWSDGYCEAEMLARRLLAEESARFGYLRAWSAVWARRSGVLEPPAPAEMLQRARQRLADGERGLEVEAMRDRSLGAERLLVAFEDPGRLPIIVSEAWQPLRPRWVDELRDRAEQLRPHAVGLRAPYRAVWVPERIHALARAGLNHGGALRTARGMKGVRVVEG